MGEEAKALETSEETGQEEVVEDTFESVAEQLGWNPDFKGDNPIGAKEFILNSRPIQDNMKHQMGRLQGSIEKLTVNYGRDLKAKTDQIREDLKAKQLEAVGNADTEAYQEVTKQLDQVADPRQVAFDEGLTEFKSRNDWFGRDRTMTAEANLIGSALLNAEGEFSEIGPTEFYEEVLKGVKQRFPDKFSNPRRQQSSNVVGDDGPPPKTNSSWGKAKAEVPGLEDAFLSFVEEGVYKDTKESREKYAKQVLEE